MESMEAAFFDLDKTVIDRASIAAFGRPFMKGGLINRRVVARAAISQLIYLHFGADASIHHQAACALVAASTADSAERILADDAQEEVLVNSVAHIDDERELDAYPHRKLRAWDEVSGWEDDAGTKGDLPT